MADTLDWLNSLPPDRCIAEFLRCCGSSRWALKMVKNRPYLSPEKLFEAARRHGSEMIERDWMEAFSHHPRIGQKIRAEASLQAKWASHEQSGVRSASEATIQALADWNRRYEEKFGFVFLVCATGKSAEEMLALLQTRMQNTLEVEIRLAAAEQGKITQIRLEKLINHEP